MRATYRLWREMNQGAQRVLDPAREGGRTAVGTPLYMSPEQARGFTDLDGRSDIFSLAVVLYKGLTGVSSFAGETVMAVLAKVCLDHPAPLHTVRSDLPQALVSLIESMLTKHIDSRPQDVKQLLDAFTLLGGSACRPVLTTVADALSMDEQRVVALASRTLCFGTQTALRASRHGGLDW